MMKLKRYLKNLIKPALCLNIILSSFIFGCSTKEIEPSYSEKDIPDIVKKICREEYNLEVAAARTANTLWIYVPLSKLMHKDYRVKEDKFFGEEMMEKSRNILNTVGRVLISSDRAPEFFVLAASDINLGIDCYIIGNSLDIKKSYAGSIPWTEANRRYVVKLGLVPEAKQDTTGAHVKTFDIKLADFLAQQITQRVSAQFKEEGQRQYFKPEAFEGEFLNDRFIFEYIIKQVSAPPKKTDIKKEILDTITYCIRTYEFKDFSSVEIRNALTKDTQLLSRAEIWARPMP